MHHNIPESAWISPEPLSDRMGCFQSCWKVTGPAGRNCGCVVECLPRLFFYCRYEKSCPGQIRRKAVFSLVGAGEDKRDILWPVSGTPSPNSRGIRRKTRGQQVTKMVRYRLQHEESWVDQVKRDSKEDLIVVPATWRQLQGWWSLSSHWCSAIWEKPVEKNFSLSDSHSDISSSTLWQLLSLHCRWGVTLLLWQTKTFIWS